MYSAKRFDLFALAALAFAIAGCASHGGGIVPDGGQGDVRRGRANGSPIQHVIVIMQENRTFDNFFHGFPGADSATYGYGHGVKYTLEPINLGWGYDPNHYHWQFLEDYDQGKNDGFDLLIYKISKKGDCKYNDYWPNEPECWVFRTGDSYKRMAFTYVPEEQIQPYWDMAAQYTLGDRTFSSNNGPTFVSHQYMIAGQSGHASEVPSAMPWGCDAPKETEYYMLFGQADPPVFSPATGHEKNGSYPCFPMSSHPSSSYPTIADLLDAAGISWKYYVVQHTIHGIPQDSYWLNAFDAVRSIRFGPDWKKDISMPDTNVLKDVKGGTLAQVSWVMPHKYASDHPGRTQGKCGPNWVASIVNAVGQSPYWRSTAIFIMWDDWGGWYDHVVPPQYADPQTGAYEGLGYRVPLIVVSPYAKAGYVSHRQHEIVSTLHFIEKNFGLPFLGAASQQMFADQRADAFSDVFNYSQKPIVFKRIKPIPGLEGLCSHWVKQIEPEIDY
ncbi:MAG TPA: alkaline phosphatase family protein [Candidatus Tumulicola sp.]